MSELLEVDTQIACLMNELERQEKIGMGHNAYCNGYIYGSSMYGECRGCGNGLSRISAIRRMINQRQNYILKLKEILENKKVITNNILEDYLIKDLRNIIINYI